MTKDGEEKEEKATMASSFWQGLGPSLMGKQSYRSFKSYYKFLKQSKRWKTVFPIETRCMVYIIMIKKGLYLEVAG